MDQATLPWMFSTRCRILAFLTVVIIFMEITMVNRWETLNTTNPSATSSLNMNKWNIKSSFRELEIDFNGGIPSIKKEIDDILNMKGGDYNSNELPEVTDDATHTQALVEPQTTTIRSSFTTTNNDSMYIQSELIRRLKAATDRKIILVWIPMFGVKDPHPIDAKKCGNCEVTYDRNKINDEKTGAVVFHFDAIRANNMPSTRNLSQLYIYWDLESTATLRVVRGQSLQFEDNFHFNGTMTYRRDSDFYQSYEHGYNVARILEENTRTPEELLAMKTKLSVAIVSNCGYTPGARTRIKMLKELIGLGFKLEGFGGCFKGGKFANGKGRGEPEFFVEVRKYKFYFSFENSHHCKDYITEKFFNNAIRSLTVPVVWGANKKDYEAVAPPGSFIFAEDFASMKDLADYLNYLDKNDTAYLEYLKWLTMKPSDMPQYGRAREWCSICRALHGINYDDSYSPKYNKTNPVRPLFTDGVAPRTVEHLIDWYYGEDNPECFSR
uniref:4-galactosyl-N-acetylglucosaminide 3-alpha-L-fucosyltransferase FUT5-like n=1 Tax=Styela clava TaxID=7725 RepID=UPI0019395457|nr:4-galactosyl-N-acetylglucosaminide 3-alpha-L-fucosyltransferase FUT5-like [Styela clava]